MRSDLFKRDSRRMRLLLLWAVGVCTMQAAFNMYLIIHCTFRSAIVLESSVFVVLTLLPFVAGSCTQGRGAEIILAPSQINALQPLSCLLVGVPVQVLLASRACAVRLFLSASPSSLFRSPFPSLSFSDLDGSSEHATSASASS